MKFKKNIKILGIILVVFAILLTVIFNNKKEIQEIFGERRLIFEGIEEFNLSLILYDSAVGDGNTVIRDEDIWNATSGETRVITTQVNVSNSRVDRNIQPGELIVTVDSLGKAIPTNNDKTTFKTVTTISADLASNSTKNYDWSYTYDSDNQKYIFTNNNVIEQYSSFESTIQLAFEVKAYEVLNGADIILDANLNNVVNSTNTINFKFTSTERAGTISMTTNKISSYDGLGANASDYIWVKFYPSASTDGYGTTGVRGALFDYYIEESVPTGCILLDYQMNEVLPDENSIYKLASGSGRSYNNNSSNYSYNSYINTSLYPYYIGFPKSIYQGQSVDLEMIYKGKYKDSYYVDGENKELQTLDTVSKTLNLDDFEFSYSGNLYGVDKYHSSNYNASYNKIVDSNKGDDVTYYINGSTIYTGTKYKVRYGDDLLYITNEEDEYIKLTDNEYYFKSIKIPAYLFNGNGIQIDADKYDIDLYVRYRGTNTYVKYGETLKNKKGTAQTITFEETEKVVGWYIEIYDLEESLNFNGNTSCGFYTIVNVQKSSGIAETGKIYNFDYLQVYNKNADNTYTLMNETDESSYTTTITNDIASFDINTYGHYLQRNYAYSTYGADYENFSASYNTPSDKGYDNNFYYRELKFEARKTLSSTGTNEFDGIRAFVILPEGTELNATKEELIQKISSNNFYSYALKPDGTGFTSEEFLGFFKEHTTINIDTNYKNEGKTWIEYVVDFSDCKLDTYLSATHYADFPYFNIPIKIPYEVL